MLLVTRRIILVLLLFYNNGIGDAHRQSVRHTGCDNLAFGGEWTLTVGLKLRKNLVNVFGYLEKQKVHDLDPGVFKYFSNLKERLRNNLVDIFPLIKYVPKIYNAKSSSTAIFIISKALEKANSKQQCQWKCSLKKWEHSMELKNLLDNISKELLLRGIPGGTKRILQKYDTIGSKFQWDISPQNHTEEVIMIDFGQSVLKILRDIETHKICFSEAFFAKLLHFYPWPHKDSEIQFSVSKLAHYFNRPNANFYVCNIVLKELFNLIDYPMTILDYILNKMDVSECVPNLKMDVKKLIHARDATNPQVSTETVDSFEYMKNLLQVIKPNVYPVELILARDRVYNYMTKVLPFFSQGGFVPYFYDTYEEKLYALLNYIEQKQPFPIPCVRDSIKALQSHLYFRVGAKVVSAELLDIIVNAWLAPDLLHGVRLWAMRLKRIIRQERSFIDSVLLSKNQRICMGMDSCYATIVSLLNANQKASGFIKYFEPPPCLLKNVNFCVGNVQTIGNTSDFNQIFEVINFHDFPINAVLAAKTLLEFPHLNKLGLPGKFPFCTKAELLLATLQLNIRNPIFVSLQDVMTVIIASIKNKLNSDIPPSKTIEVSPKTIPSSDELSTLQLLNLLSTVRGMKATANEFEAAIMLVKEDEEIINEVLSTTSCRFSENTASCLRDVLTVVENTPPNNIKLEDNYALSFLLRPTVCDKSRCFWLPNEEKESGPLNPIVLYLSRLLVKLNLGHSNFNLKSDFIELISEIRNRDISCAFERFRLSSQDLPQDLAVQFLLLLKNCSYLGPSLEKVVHNILDYLRFGKLPTTIGIDDLINIAVALIQNTTDSEVAQIIKENMQQLTINEFEVQKVLDTLRVDCETMEKCVSSLAVETKYSTNKIVIAVAGIVNPKPCTNYTCPWLMNTVESSKSLEKALSQMLSIITNPKTPLSIVFALQRLTDFLRSQEGQFILNQIGSIIETTNDPLAMIFHALIQSESLSHDIREDAQKSLNYIKDGALPTSFCVDDLIKFLMLLSSKTNNANIRKMIVEAVRDLQTHAIEINNILMNTKIHCVSLSKCLSGIAEVHNLPNSVVTVLMTFLQENHEEEGPEKMQNTLIQEVTKLINDNRTPLHIRLDLKEILTMLKNENLAPILATVMESLPKNLFLELLLNIPLTIKNKYGIYNSVSHVIQYLMQGTLPTSLDLNTFKSLAYILIGLTTDVQIANNMESTLNMLEQLPAASQLLSVLPVKCDRIQSCVDSILRSVKEAPTQNIVYQLINNIIHPVGCTPHICSWTRPDGSNNFQNKVAKLREDLLEATQGKRTPLIIKIYGNFLLKYFTTDIIKMFPMVNTLGEVLDSMSRNTKLSQKVSDVALSILKFLHRNIVPTILTHEDFFELTEVLSKSTPDVNVKLELKNNNNKLQQYPDNLDSLLMVCEIKCVNLKTCVASLLECARSQPQNPAATILLKYLKPSECTRETCPWLGIDATTSDIPFNVLINDTMREITYLEHNTNIPFHIQLILRQLKVFVKTHRLERMVLYNNSHILPFKLVSRTTLQKMEDNLQTVIPANITNEYGIAMTKLLKETPVSLLTKFHIFNSILDVMYYFSEGKIPQYLDVQTMQILAKVLTVISNSTQHSHVILSNAKALNDLPDIEKWMSLLPVSCQSFEMCISSLKQSLTTVIMPDYVFQSISAILSKPICKTISCRYIVGSDYQIMEVIDKAKNHLKSIRQSLNNVPLSVKLAVDQAIKYFNIENLKVNVQKGSKTLSQLLQDIVNDIKYPTEVKDKVNIILRYLQDVHYIPKEFTSNDLLLVIQEMIAVTQDLFLQQEISSIGNKIYQHAKDFQPLLKQCALTCMDLRQCLQNLQNCASKGNPLIQDIVMNLVYPPDCTRDICWWMPEVNPTLKPLPVVKPVYILAFLPNENESQLIMLNLKDYSVLTALQELSTRAKPNSENVFLIIQNSDGKPIHLALDLSEPEVQRTLSKLGSNMEPCIDFNTMETITILFPFSDGRIRSFTYDLTNTEVRLKLLQLSNQNSGPGKHKVPIIDNDGVQRMLAIDEADQLFMQELLGMSVEGRRKTDQPSLILWLSQTGRWRSMDLANITEFGYIALKGTPQYVGLPVDYYVTPYGLLIINFDMNSSHIRYLLDFLRPNEPPTVDLNLQRNLSLIIPREDGSLQSIRLNLTDEFLNRLVQLSQEYWPNITERRALILIRRNDTISTVYFEPNNDELKQLLLDFTGNLEWVDVRRQLLMPLEHLNDVQIRGTWKALNVQDTTNFGLVVLQNLPKKNIIGYPTDIIETAVGFVKISFDVYDSRIIRALDNLPQDTPVIDLNESNLVAFTYPNDYGKLTTVYVEMSDDVVKQMKILSKKNPNNTFAPTFIIKESYNSIPISLDPEQREVKQFLQNFLPGGGGSSSGARYATIKSIINDFLEGLLALIKSSNLPLIMKLECQYIYDVLSTDEGIMPLLNLKQDLITKLEILAESILDGVPNINYNGNLIAQFLESIPQTDLITINIADSVNALLAYYRSQEIPTNLNIITLIQLVNYIAQDANDSVVAQLEQVKLEILKLPDINDQLILLPVLCNVIDTCVYNIDQAVKILPKDSPLRQILTSLVNIIKTGEIVAKRTPLEEVLDIVVVKMEASLENIMIPFHIRLDMSQIIVTLKNERNKEEILSFVSKLSNAMKQQITENAKSLMETITTQIAVNAGEIISNGLRLLPFSKIRQLHIMDNVNNVVSYFERETIPDTLNVNTLNQLVNILADNSTNEKVTVDMKAKMHILKMKPDSDKWISQFAVDCTTIQSCVDSLVTSLLELPIEDEDTTLLKTILNPPECTVETCFWVVEEQGVGKHSPIMRLFETALKQMCNQDLSKVPVHIVWDIKSVCETLNNPENKNSLQQVLTSLPQSEIEEMNTESANLLSRLNSTSSPTLSELIENSLETLPNTYLDMLKIHNSIRHIYNYLQTGVLPYNLDQKTFEYMVASVVNNLTNQNYILGINHKMEVVRKYDNIDETLEELPVRCQNIELCLETLTQSLQTVLDQGELEKLLLDVVTTVKEAHVRENKHKKHPKYMVVPLKIGNHTHHAILDLSNDKVKEILESMTNIINPKYPTLLFNMVNKDGKLVTIRLDGSDQATAQILKRLEDETKKPISPIKIDTESGTFIIGTVLNPQSELVYFIIKDDKNTYENFLKYNSSSGTNTVKLPFKYGTVNIGQQDLVHITNELAENVTYLPRDCFMEPEVISLPNGYYVYPKWKQLPTRPDLKWGTKVALVGPDCEVKFVTINLRDRMVLTQLQTDSKVTYVKPEDKSILIISVPDKYPKVHQIILDLNNPVVLKELKIMSERVNTTSYRRYVVYYESSDGSVTPLVFDLNDLDIDKLQQISENTPAEMLPVYTNALGNNSEVTAFVVTTPDGKKHNIILNVSDENVVNKLKEMNQPKRHHITVLEIHDKYGRPVRIYIDKNDEKVAATLIHLSENNVISERPLMITDKPSGRNIIVTDDVRNGKVNYVLNVNDSRVIQALKNLEINAPENAPIIQIIKPDGSVEFIKLDIDNSNVRKVLKDLAQQVTIERPDNSLIVIKVSGSEPIVLDAKNEIVVEQLKNLTADTDLTKPNLNVFVIVDKFGNHFNIILDINDRRTIEILRNLQAQTTPSDLKPTPVITQNDNVVTVIIVHDKNGNAKALIIDGTNSTIEKLQEVSDRLNPNAERVIVTDENNNVHVFYLPLHDSKVLEILENISNTSMIELPPQSSSNTKPGDKIISVPFITNNGVQDEFRCNVSDEQVAKILFKWASVKGPKPIMYQVEVIDFSGNNRLLVLDTAHPKVLSELNKVCTTLPKSEDLLLITVVDDNNRTISFILNTKDAYVQKKLKELSNMTLAGTSNVTEIQLTDSNGKMFTVSLDLNNKFVIEGLFELHEYSSRDINSGTRLKSQTGEENLLVLKVKDSNTGHIWTLVLDTNDPKVRQFLIEISNGDNPNAIPVQLETQNGKVTVYVDEQNTLYSNIIMELASQRLPLAVVTLQPQYNETTIVSLPLIHHNHSVVVTLNLSNPDVKRIIKEYNVPPGPDSHGVYIKEDNGTVNQYRVQMANSVLTWKLMLVSDKYDYIVEEQSLMIIPILRKDNFSEYIVLDLKNEFVLNSLEKIENMGKKENRTSFQYITTNGATNLICLDLNDEIVQNQLRVLQRYTPDWMRETEAANPYGGSPYIIATITDSSSGILPIVLDTNNQTAMDTLKQLETPDPIHPLVFKYSTPDGNEVKIILDATNPQVVNTLRILSRPQDNYPNEILTNRPSISTTMDSKLVIPIYTPEGQTINYIFDISDFDVFENILSLASPPDVPSRVIYMQNPNGETSAIRIDTSNNEIISQLAEYSQSRTIKANPKNLLTLVSPYDQGGREVTILDTSDSNIVKGLKRISENSTGDASITVFMVTDEDHKNIPIALDLHNPATLEDIKELGKITPTKILPVFVKPPIGLQPFVIFTLEGLNDETVHIVLDLNNPIVLRTLKSLSDPNYKQGIFFNILDENDEPQKIFLNEEDYNVQDVLKKLTKLTPFVENGIVTVDPEKLLEIPVIGEDNEKFNILLDPMDTLTVEKLIYLSQISNGRGPSIILNINVGGVVKPIKLDRRNPVIVQELKKLGKKLLFPIVHPVKPGSGDVPLVSLEIPLSKNRVEIITLDVNNPEVINELNAINALYGHQPNNTRLIVPLKTGQMDVNMDTSNPNVIEALKRISKLAPVSIVPTKVIPPAHKIPLTTITIPNDDLPVVVTLDLEDDHILDQLRYYRTVQSPSTITLLFDTPNANKENITLDIVDPRVIQKLKSISRKLPVRIIPVDGRAIISATLEDEIINLDITNSEVLKSLKAISKLPDNEYYKKTTIEIKTEENLITPLKLGINNPRIRDTLREIGKKTRLPTIKTRIMGIEIEADVRILPPQQIYPLVTIEIGNELITVDLNNYQVLNKLHDLSQNQLPQATTILVSNTEGNKEKLSLDLQDPRVIDELKRLSNLSPLRLVPKPNQVPVIVVNIPDKHGKKRPVSLDFNDPVVWDTFAQLDQKDLYQNSYRIQMPLRNGFKVFSIDFTNPEVIQMINNVITGSSSQNQPYFVKFQVPDNVGNTWQIVLDSENPEVLLQLKEREKITPFVGSTTVQLPKPNGMKVEFRLNLRDASTINLLKKLTQLSTGSPPKKVKEHHRRLFEFNITTPAGYVQRIRLDINNENVMIKLVELSNMFQGSVKTIVKIRTPDGRDLKVALDLSDPVTITNLLNLQTESLGGKPVPLEPVGTPTNSGQKMLISFDIKTPGYGDLTITLDVYLPGMMDKIEKLSRTFVKGRPETQVPIDDQRGRSLTLSLDLTNKDTIDTLAMLTQESTGKNPLENAKVYEPVRMPELLTLEIPYSTETALVTLDKTDRNVIQTLIELNDPNSNRSTALEVDTGNGRANIRLELFNRVILKKLKSVMIPTVAPVIANKVSLLTLIFFQSTSNTPLLIDLSERSNVLNIISLSQKYQYYMRSPTYLEVRDDTGQYLRIPLDLSDFNVENELKLLYPPQPFIQIDARTMPYLQLVVPSTTGLAFNVIDFQLKPKIIKSLETQVISTNNGFNLQILDALEQQTILRLDVNAPQFLTTIARLEGTVLLEPPHVQNEFIIYTLNEKGEHQPIYLNMHDAETLEAVNSLQYSPNLPLTVIQFLDERGQLQYRDIDITNLNNLSYLSRYSHMVTGHSILKQKKVETVVLRLPNDNQGNVPITLNLADPNVVRELKAISQETGASATAVVELEDGEGFPILLKIDYTNKRLMDRLLALNRPN